MSWNVATANRIRKDLAKIPKRETNKILAAIEEFSRDPHLGDTKKMKGESVVWRRRIGEYRIFMNSTNGSSLYTFFE